MTNDTKGNPNRVIYTCWPFGGVVCGIVTAILGGTMILSTYFPDAPEIVWGVALIALGVFIAVRSQGGGDALR